MGMVKEFKEFIMRGNVMDMAVGVVIGGAFSAIVKSLVDDVIMPVVGLITGGTDFSHLGIVLSTDASGAPLSTLAYGKFITAIVTFLIIAFCIFLVVKGVNKLRDLGSRRKAEEPEAPAEPTAEEKQLALLQDILNELKNSNGPKA